jgi:hypothetical protein
MSVAGSGTASSFCFAGAGGLLFRPFFRFATER